MRNSANCIFHKLLQFCPLSLELWCVTFYGQYTIVFFDMMILLGEAVTNLLAPQIEFVIMPDWPFFGCILYNVFGEGSNIVIVSG